MLISMTGFGQGEASDDKVSVSVEIRTVNHRFLDYSFRLPRALNAREHEIKERIRKKLTRGRIYVVISAENETPSGSVGLNRPLLEQYVTLLRGFAKDSGIRGDLDINTVAHFPDIFTANDNCEDADRLWPLVEKALDTAIDECFQMRLAEGAALEADLRSRLSVLEKTVTEIEKLAPDIPKKHAEMFKKRIDKLTDNTNTDQDRLVIEIALMADRLDITEEITRLRSHLDQINQAVESGGEVSKKLTYLLQEVHRESSTIGAKASDSEVVKHVVTLKEETEKLREQTQNIE